MSRIAVMCPQVPGHLHPMLAVVRELRARGHSCTLFGIGPPQAGLLEQIDFQPLQDPAVEPLLRDYALSRTLLGQAANRKAFDCFAQAAGLMSRVGPPALKAAGMQLLLSDQLSHAAATVAQAVAIPWVTLCVVPPFHADPDLPHPLSSAAYRSDGLGRLRNRWQRWWLERAYERPILKLLNEVRQQWRLAPHTRRDDLDSPYAQLSQLVPGLDFPWSPPAQLHYCGLLHRPPGDSTPIVTGHPLVFLSLSTNLEDFSLFHCVAQGCKSLDVQLIIARSGSRQQELRALAQVVSGLPSLEKLSQAAAVVCHGGVGTVLETLAAGVPLVIIPLGLDQHAVAARVARAGAGVVLSHRGLSPQKVTQALRTVLVEPHYRSRAQEIQTLLLQPGGARRAAEVVESVPC